MKSYRVLILEDDESQCAALAEAFKRVGHQVLTAHKPDEARPYLAKGTVDWLFVDCLLPQISGADFVKEVRTKWSPERLSIVFMSGIFTDSAFVDEALQKFQAVKFLEKPFDIKDAVAILGPGTVQKEMSPRQELYALLARPKLTPRQQRKAIERVEEIYGFDLPYIYSMLVETKASGHLNIVDPEGNLSGISFSNGSIVAVDAADKETLLGTLIIDAGYLDKAELEAVLNNQSNRRIGQKLIEENLVSPHAFEEILAQQMNIRLSRTVIPKLVKVNFVASEVEDSFPRLGAEEFLPYLHDWVASKITPSWIENHYRLWSDFSLKTRKPLSLENPVFATPLLKKLPQITTMLSGGKTINEILETKDLDKVILFKALHLLFISGTISFSEKISSIDKTKTKNRLKVLDESFKDKNYFEIFEIMGGQRDLIQSELHNVYEDFVTMLGESPADEDTRLVWERVTGKCQEAYDLLRDDEKRKVYQQRLEQGDMEKRFTAEQKFEEAQTKLKNSHYQQALTILQEVEKLNPEKEGLRLHLLWAKFGCFDTHQDKKSLTKSIEGDLLQIPPEEKHLPLASFVTGLHYKQQGDILAAKREFEKAANMDPGFVQARRELHFISIKQQKAQEKPKDFLKRDLRDLVGSFFKKKDSA